ncbi:MAG TPA: pseudouridine synthase [Thermodesulfobacteriota bacterium]|nr:pseudouridine synthase [Thermodesulfobacteriota bacterium]
MASRRKAEEMILEGLVTVNRQVVTELGTKADPEKDRITVDGRLLSHAQEKSEKVYILLNKPKGYISTVSDPQGRPTVIDLVKKIKTRMFPVGRLDYDAEGALLFTNDGELANKLIHPKYHIPKKYLVKVSDAPDQKDISKLKKGVYLEDGRTLPAEAKFIKSTKTNSWIELTVYEGKNRLVKRMCFAIGHSVLKLQRTEFAGIKLGSLKQGDFRTLTMDEVERLKKIVSVS